jgi:hypothetical protein
MRSKQKAIPRRMNGSSGVVCLFITMLGLLALTVQARAERGCTETVAGGGRVETPSGGLASFSVVVLFDSRADSYAGRFHYIDKTAGLRLSASSLLDYGIIDPTMRIISFAIAGSSDYDEARVVLTDLGRGGDEDVIEVQLLLNGNILYQTPPALAHGSISLMRHDCP